MHRLRLTVLPSVAAVAGVVLACVLPSLAVASSPNRLIVPGKSVGPVHLGEPKADVHIGPSESNGSGGFFYSDYSLTVAYQNGKVVAISITLGTHPSPGELVAPGQYETHGHPRVGIPAPMANVRSRYPSAKCAHHSIPGPPTKGLENCLLKSKHGHTFFAGIAAKPGSVLYNHIGAILVTVPGAGPKAP
jgi:hypothetical protein